METEQIQRLMSKLSKGVREFAHLMSSTYHAYGSLVTGRSTQADTTLGQVDGTLSLPTQQVHTMVVISRQLRKSVAL